MSTTEQTTVDQSTVEQSIEDLARAVDEAAAKVRALDRAVRAPAEELRHAIEAVHRAGLLAIVRRLREDPAGRALLFELVDEPAVYLLLSLHGLVRPDPTTHARRVLDGIRPALRAQGGDAELVRVADGVARVRLHGACTGNSLASLALRQGVEDALLGQVPGITAMDAVLARTPTLIPLLPVGRSGTGCGAGGDSGCGCAGAPDGPG